jgi:uncharacterized protein (DUF1330 family)
MAVYMLLEIQVHDPDTYAEYVRRVPPTIARHGGRYVVRGGPVVPLAGDWRPERIVILEFPTAEAMQRWAASPEYLAIAPLRERAATTRAVALQGWEAGRDA